jgi:hypothetical protein
MKGKERKGKERKGSVTEGNSRFKILMNCLKDIV